MVAQRAHGCDGEFAVLFHESGETLWRKYVLQVIPAPRACKYWRIEVRAHTNRDTYTHELKFALYPHLHLTASTSSCKRAASCSRSLS
jgi:hypothetical protein